MSKRSRAGTRKSHSKTYVLLAKDKRKGLWDELDPAAPERRLLL